MRLIAAFAMSVVLSEPAMANDWEKFYRAYPGANQGIEAVVPPEIVPSSDDADSDMEAMWRKGFAPIGFTSFTSSNGKTADAVRFARKLKARYLIVATNLASSATIPLPLTLPTAQTTYSNGTATAYGSGGYARGTYSGTSTTYGSQTTYMPITVQSFTKLAVFFREMPKVGAGIMQRDLTNAEMARLGTRHVLAVRFVRDGSPAFIADVFPGDLITMVNGRPFSEATWAESAKGPQPMKLQIIRNGQARELEMTIPPEWQPQ